MLVFVVALLDCVCGLLVGRCFGCAVPRWCFVCLCVWLPGRPVARPVVRARDVRGWFGVVCLICLVNVCARLVWLFGVARFGLCVLFFPWRPGQHQFNHG